MSGREHVIGRERNVIATKIFLGIGHETGVLGLKGVSNEHIGWEPLYTRNRVRGIRTVKDQILRWRAGPRGRTREQNFLKRVLAPNGIRRITVGDSLLIVGPKPAIFTEVINTIAAIIINAIPSGFPSARGIAKPHVLQARVGIREHAL